MEIGYKSLLSFAVVILFLSICLSPIIILIMYTIFLYVSLATWHRVWIEAKQLNNGQTPKWLAVKRKYTQQQPQQQQRHENNASCRSNFDRVFLLLWLPNCYTLIITYIQKCAWWVVLIVYRTPSTCIYWCMCACICERAYTHSLQPYTAFTCWKDNKYHFGRMNRVRFEIGLSQSKNARTHAQTHTSFSNNDGKNNNKKAHRECTKTVSNLSRIVDADG